MNARKFISVLLLATQACWSQTPPSNEGMAGEKLIPLPILRIETGAHTGQIRGIATDAAGRLVLTVSDDKTARLWDASGRLLRVLQPFRSVNGMEGLLQTGALHPKGTLAAVGGYSRGTQESGTRDHRVYLFDTASGEIVRTVGRLPQIVVKLCFSKSGKYLAAVCGAGGLYIWDVASGELLAQDEARGKITPGLDWHGDDKIATACHDNHVRFYTFQAGTLKLVNKAEYAISQAASIRFNPGGTHVALGSQFDPTVEVINVQKPELGYFLELKEAGFFNLPSVAWSSDGQYLAAGGYWTGLAGVNNRVRIWKVPQATVVRDVPAGQVNVWDLQELPGGGFLYANGTPAWGVIADPRPVASKNKGRSARPSEDRSATPRMNYMMGCDSFRISPVGDVVSILPFGSREPMVFSIPSRRFGLGAREAGLTWVTPQTGSLPVTDWKNHGEPKLHGVPLQTLGASRALAISPDNTFFVLGNDASFSIYTAEGKLKSFSPTTGRSWAVNISADSRVVAAAVEDGTIYWRSMVDGRGLLNLYAHPDGRRWVLWTPEGFYDCAPGAEDLLHLVVNREPDQAADTFPISRFRKLFYRPDVIQWVLKRASVADAEIWANRRLGRQYDDPARVAALKASLSPPVVKLETGGVFREVVLPPDATSLDLTYGVRQTGPEPVTKVEVRANGRPTGVSAPIPGGDGVATVSVPLTRGFEGEVSVIASHALSHSAVTSVRVRRSAPVRAKTLPPNLHVLSIGVAQLEMNQSRLAPADNALASGQAKSHFQNLEFATEDAKSVASLWSGQQGKVYGKVETTLLLDEQATTGAVRAAIRAISEKAQPGDVFIFYFSGHGNHDPKTGKFNLITFDTDPHREEETAFSGEEMTRLLGGVRAAVVVALDACHSGSVLGMQLGEKYKVEPLDIAGLANQLSSSDHGIVVLSSSTPDQVSFEDRELGGGIFTKAFLEGLSGKAARDGAVTCSSLMQWVNKRVPELTAGDAAGPEQTPITVMPTAVPDFTLARPSSRK